MIKQPLFVLLIPMLLLSACTAGQPLASTATPIIVATATPLPSATPAPTITPIIIPTSTATPTPTLTPSVLLEDTVLFQLPDPLSERVTFLHAGSLVLPQGRYNDFVQVTVRDSVNGFVPIQSLSVARNIPKIDISQVQWRQVDAISHFSIHPDVEVEGGSTIIVDNSQHDYYNDDLSLTISVDTPFQLIFRLSTNNGQFGSLKLTDKPNNNTEGEWWQGIHRVDFVTDQGRLRIEIRDGLAENTFTTIDLQVRDSQTITVNFEDPFGKVFTVTDGNGHQLTRVDVTDLTRVSLPQGLFPERKVYIGRVASPFSKLTIQHLTLSIQPSGRWQELTVDTVPTLRESAEQRQISVGTLLNWWRLRDERYWDVLFNNSNTLIIHDFDGSNFWLGRREYNFERVDRLVDWAIRSGFRVRAFHLAWGALENEMGGVPQWLRETDYSKEEYIEILEEYTRDVVGHFRGRVAEWSIANEAVSRSFYPGGDFWNEKIGPEYVGMLFRWAHEADPDAILILNDFNNESPRDGNTQRVINRMYATVKSLKDAGVPIHGVGMQMHLLLPWSSQIPPNKEDVILTMQRFAELGVDIYITELDVSIHNCHRSSEECLQFQAQIYQDMAEACLESGVCKSFTTFGLTDDESWITCTEEQWGCVGLTNAAPLLFDAQMQPKPAFFAVYNAFAGKESGQ